MPVMAIGHKSKPRPRAASAADAASAAAPRPRACGKFLYAGEEKLWIRGVTYGPFRPGEDGCEYPGPDVVERDFEQMIACGVNTVRTYTAPPRWFLDAAWRRGMRVIVGLAWEQHVAFLNDPERAESIVERVRLQARACAGHPAVLCYAVGNEIPSSIVRWHGARAVERFIERLYRAVKAEDPGALATYVNYPTTEYLQLPFVDLVCFNVFLEVRERFAAYAARLQTIAGDRPLVLTEIGADSLRHGEETPEAVAWQIREAFAAACAGVCIFAWTDEWYRGGEDIDDWAFGLTDAQRRPKPALDAVRRAFADAPFPAGMPWPRVSVIVCTYNGAATLGACLEALRRLDYPDYEVIVVNDGSRDATASIAGKYPCTVVTTPNNGLSAARNRGRAEASGEIIAYIDDDAVADRDWLRYLAAAFLRTRHAAIGGPNIPPPAPDLEAACVASAPGAPIHVLLTDDEAEHLPGCNLAFRRSALDAIGGFDHRFRVAGDDVDVCWRLQARGWTLGFAPGAMVWHRRRQRAATYWAQQRGYGRAEGMLERKWPHKYNGVGQHCWRGRLYADWLGHSLGWVRGRIYQGMWGLAPYQSVRPEPPSVLAALPTVPEWYLLVAGLAVLAAFAPAWARLWWAVPALAATAGFSAVQAGFSAVQALRVAGAGPNPARDPRFLLTAWLHLCQPAARLRGHLAAGLTPWRRYHAAENYATPRPREVALWHPHWLGPEAWLERLEADLRDLGVLVSRGGAYDRWDLHARVGTMGGVHTLLAIEAHEAGAQVVRMRCWPHVPRLGWIATAACAALAAGAACDHAWFAAGLLGAGAGALGLRVLQDCAASTAAFLRAAMRHPLPGHPLPRTRFSGRTAAGSVEPP